MFMKARPWAALRSLRTRGRRVLEPSLETLQGPVVDGGAGAESADAGRREIENVDDHNGPHDTEERYHYMYLLARETQLKAEGGSGYHFLGRTAQKVVLVRRPLLGAVAA